MLHLSVHLVVLKLSLLHVVVVQLFYQYKQRLVSQLIKKF